MKKMIVALLVMFGMTMAVSAEGMNGKIKNENRGGMYKLLKQVDLTIEQQTELKALKKSSKAMRKENKEAFKAERKKIMKGKKLDMASFMSDKTFDKVAYKKALRKKMNAMRKVMQKRRESVIEARAINMEKVFTILTEDQRVKLIELSQK